jgi:hypothetical protein
MFRVRLAKMLLLGSLVLPCGCACPGDRPLLDRIFNRNEAAPCCGEVSASYPEGPVLQDYGPYPPGTTYQGGGVPSTSCPQLVPQGSPLPPLSAPPGVRIQPTPTGNAPVEPYRPLPRD